MHLRAIKLRGFKSFPDPVEIRLEPGVAVVVGPNGSGKSNVADAIVWAAGSMAPSELRAEKPDDVLFAGGAERRESASDDFWSWRDRMYAVALRIGPEQLRAVAAQLYVELLRGGYTHVCEFHYLRRDRDGSEHADPLAPEQAGAGA